MLLPAVQPPQSAPAAPEQPFLTHRAQFNTTLQLSVGLSFRCGLRAHIGSPQSTSGPLRLMDGPGCLFGARATH